MKLLVNQNSSTTGNPVKSDGWYGKSDHIHTVGVYTSNFFGSIFIEGCLVENPSESDWFIIKQFDWVQGDNIQNKAASFSGIYSYIRARAEVGFGRIDRVIISL